VRWLRDHARATTIVDPFCGVGTVLAVANQHGLDAIGIEIAASRAEKARDLVLSGESDTAE
jgi:tRNA G10  N-methylase Trm11